MKKFIELANLQPQFWGSVRVVYVHPNNSDLLIKVPRQEAHDRIAQVPEWKKRFKPLGAGSMNMHELRETMRLRPQPAQRLKHFFNAVAMIQTDLGWGLVVEAEYDSNGNYAATIASMVNDEERYKKPLAAFMDWLNDTPAVFYDLNPWNVLLAHRDGKDEIIAIDGMGEKSAIQFRTYFPSINKKKNQKEKERFFRFIDKIRAEKNST